MKRSVLLKAALDTLDIAIRHHTPDFVLYCLEEVRKWSGETFCGSRSIELQQCYSQSPLGGPMPLRKLDRRIQEMKELVKISTRKGRQAWIAQKLKEQNQ